jgi:hypothetical protein
MASYKRTRRSHRLRTSKASRDSSIERRETPARTNRSRPSRRLRKAPSNGYGKLGYRMASVAAVVLGMSVLVDMAIASAPTVLPLEADGVAIHLPNVLPPRVVERDSVQTKRSNLKCPQYRTTILSVGFTRQELKTLDAIIYRESRCLSYVVNRTLNKDKSHDYGLTQINGRSWCEPTRYYPDGYLQTLGILNECDDLLNPVTNLEAAFALFTYAKGFGPWT